MSPGSLRWSCDCPEKPINSRAARPGSAGRRRHQAGRENGSFFKVMNGRKRKWKGGQGEEKGTDFQIKFSGHLNKHLSRQSRGGGAGDVCELGSAGSTSAGHFK